LNPLTPTQHEHVHEILSGASHLLELINEVLDLAQVETGKLQVTVERIPIRELLVECIGLLTPLAANSGVDVILGKVPECAGLVLADRMRLKQVLLNLLYNRAGGQVHITGADDDGLLRLEIADTGHGFSAEQGERLFMAFERLGATHSAVEGAGLGLALSKRLMEAMGGEIGARSEPGHGSVFWLRLPRAPLPQTSQADDRQPVPHNALPADVRPRKVLYIEDNPVNVLLMEAMLARLPGLQLLIASLPEPGLQLAMDERPDLILLDIQLPGMDGFEVLRRLRQVVATREIPVIAVSASAMPDDLERGRAAGFANYLTKPLDMRQLLRAVAAALGQE
jgi:CheY-like chemotaxis protein